MTLATYVCPLCGHTTKAHAKATSVTHQCPKKLDHGGQRCDVRMEKQP